ncbi:MAG: pentapeptide repeat-containing protein [Methanothrix sp.]|nr:pentapeptide repeat-containing protein [Methanothrix sp.]
MSRFPDSGTFDFTCFNRVANFESVWFDKFATFYNATFRGDAQFSFSEFNGAYANFESARCIGDVYFYGSQFNTYCTFANARLEKNADFHATKYSNGVGFFRTWFFGQADFARSRFIADSIFYQAHFNNTANFLSTNFDGPVFFNDTVFCKDANFDNSQFQAPTDLSYADFNGDLKLNSTKIVRMVLDGSTFGKASRLYLAKADINRLIVSWSQIRDILSFDTAAYLSLIKNYKDLGQSNDANECYYEYRYLNQDRKSIGFSKFLDTVAWLTCGYGVRPHYALFCGMVIILIFAFIYWTGRGVEGFHDIHGHQLMIASLFYSTIAFTANSKGLPLRGRYKYLGIMEGIVGWLLMALFLVTLGRLIIGS